MVVPIPANTEFSYNSIDFPVYCVTHFDENPNWSSDGRMVMSSTIKIRAAGIFTQADADAYAADNTDEEDDLELGASLDEFMLFVRRKLQVAGKRLAYAGRGVGEDLIVNDPAG